MSDQALNDAAAAVDTAANALWQSRLQTEPALRQTHNLPLEQLPDGSLDQAQQQADEGRALLRQLATLDETTLDPDRSLTLAVLRFEAARRADAVLAWHRVSPVAPYSSIDHGMTARGTLARVVVEDAAGLDRWVALWRDLSAGLRHALDRLHAQADQGWRLARPAIAPARTAWERLGPQLAAQLDAQTHSPAAMALAPALRTAWQTEAARLRDEAVLPAVQAVVQALADPAYAAVAPNDVGLARQPGGEAEYARLIGLHLSEAQDPARIHAVGLQQLSVLAERMREVRSRLGFNGDEATFHTRLRTDPRALAPSPEVLGDRYRHCLARLQPLLPQLFHDLPASPYAVRRLDAAMEAAITFGYYEPPRRAGEPGIYFFNAGELATRLQLNVAPLTYHELAPGHHFHFARQMEMDSLHPLRRNAFGYTVFNEGWAEYAAALAEEQGLFDDPYDLYGLLSLQRFGALRLVVDTGCNALGWTLAQAQRCMREHSLGGEAEVASESLRYSTDMPGQALAYRWGFLQFMAARDDARARQGARFDLRDFHQAALGAGALPLPAWRGHLERELG
ncbi:MAG: DUF885 domain-containing protein [Ideonella sp.]|nr:DUF885 domain-containing protein [Ideonella sp.]